VNIIRQSRAKYLQWVTNANEKAKIGKEEWVHNLDEVKDYLNKATDLFELLCNEGQGPLSLIYQSALNSNVKIIKVDDSMEVISTFEVVFTRLGMIFASLQNCRNSYKELSLAINVSQEKFTDSLKHCLTFFQFAGIRMGKLNYLKRHLLSIFPANSAHKYGAVSEMDYDVLEAVYLMIEVSYTSLFLLKIFCCHDNGKVYLNLVPPLIYYGQQKNDVLREILSTKKTAIQSEVINNFYEWNRNFFKTGKFLHVWCENYHEK